MIPSWIIGGEAYVHSGVPCCCDDPPPIANEASIYNLAYVSGTAAGNRSLQSLMTSPLISFCMFVMGES